MLQTNVKGLQQLTGSFTGDFLILDVCVGYIFVDHHADWSLLLKNTLG
jgi:hypothetical protein